MWNGKTGSEMPLGMEQGMIGVCSLDHLSQTKNMVLKHGMLSNLVCVCMYLYTSRF